VPAILHGLTLKKKNYDTIRSAPVVKSKSENPGYLGEEEEPQKKEPLRVTLIGKNPVKEIRQKETVDISDFSFDSIIKKWDVFVSSIMSDKKFFLMPYIGKLELINLDGNKLKVFLNDAEGKKSFSLNKEYIGKKTTEIFGKKLSFQFEDHGGNNSKPIKEEKVINDPLVDLIISELGGEEITG